MDERGVMRLLGHVCAVSRFPDALLAVWEHRLQKIAFLFDWSLLFKSGFERSDSK